VGTVIEEIDDEITILPFKYDFTLFQDLGQHVNKKDAIVDIIGIVVEAFPVKTVPTKYSPMNVQKFVLIDDKCQFEVNLSDKSGVITRTLFGELAEQILGLMATEAMKTTSKMHIDHIYSSLETKEYIIQIKPSKQKDKESQQKYSIMYCVEQEDVENSSNLLAHPVCESSGASVLKEQGLNIHQYTTNVILPLVSQDTRETTDSQVRTSLAKKFGLKDIVPSDDDDDDDEDSEERNPKRCRA
ncbi:Replication factor A, C-terminal, partial [Dillenia turbinata]